MNPTEMLKKVVDLCIESSVRPADIEVRFHVDVKAEDGHKHGHCFSIKNIELKHDELIINTEEVNECKHGS